jgi:WD40 repeat protein
VTASCQVGYDWDSLDEQSSVYAASMDGFIYVINAITGQDDLPPYSTAWEGGAGGMVGGPPVTSSLFVRNHVAFDATTLFVGDSNGTFHGWDVQTNTNRYYVPNLAGNLAEPLSVA